MTIKERIKDRLRWDGGKSYKGVVSGWEAPAVEQAEQTADFVMPENEAPAAEEVAVEESEAEEEPAPEEVSVAEAVAEAAEPAVEEVPVGEAAPEPVSEAAPEAEEPAVEEAPVAEEAPAPEIEVETPVIEPEPEIVPEPAAEPAPEPSPAAAPEPSGDPNRTLSPDEIAAMFAANAGGGAAEEPAPEPAAAPEPSGDPNRTLSPDEIAAMFAANAGGGAAEEAAVEESAPEIEVETPVIEPEPEIVPEPVAEAPAAEPAPDTISVEDVPLSEIDQMAEDADLSFEPDLDLDLDNLDLDLDFDLDLSGVEEPPEEKPVMARSVGAPSAPVETPTSGGNDATRNLNPDEIVALFAAAEAEKAETEPAPEPETAPEPSGDPNRTLSPDEIAAMFAANAGGGAAEEPKAEEPAAEAEPAAEPAPEPAAAPEPSGDPNRTLSPDEIAAMFAANAGGGAAEEPKSEEPAAETEPAAEPTPAPAAAPEPSGDPNRTLSPDEIAAMFAANSGGGAAEEPKAEEPAAEAAPEPAAAPEPSGDPNRTLSPDEIAAMFAANAGGGAAEEPKAEESAAETEPAAEPAPEPAAALEPSGDPNRTLSPDEIAAMFAANAGGGAAEEPKSEEPAAETEPAAEPAPAAVPEPSGDPNRTLSPDEIAAMFAANAGGVAAEEPKTEEPSAEAEPAAEPAPAPVVEGEPAPGTDVDQELDLDIELDLDDLDFDDTFVENIEEAVTADLNAEAANAGGDPNRTLSADEIAAMFAANSGGGAAEESKAEEPVVEEVSTPASAEEKAEPAPEQASAATPESGGDPNRNLSPDEIAAMFAANAGGGTAEEPKAEEAPAESAPAAEAAPEPAPAATDEQPSEAPAIEAEPASEAPEEAAGGEAETEEAPKAKTKGKGKGKKEKKPKKKKETGGIMGLMKGKLGRRRNVKDAEAEAVAGAEALAAAAGVNLEEMAPEAEPASAPAEAAPEKPKKDILEDVTEVYIDHDAATGEIYVDLDEAEDMARDQIIAEKIAAGELRPDGSPLDADEEEAPKPKKQEIFIDPASIKVPKRIKDEKKREQYIARAIRKKKAAIKKKEAAAAAKVKKAEAKAAKKAAKKQAKKEWKASKPQRKKEAAKLKKEKKAANKAKAAEKKAANREKAAKKKAKRKEKKEQRKAAWAAKPREDKIIIRMTETLLVLAVVIAGFTFSGTIMDAIHSMPDSMAEKKAAKQLEKEAGQVDESDATFLESVDAAVEKQNAVTDVFKEFGLSASIEAGKARAKYVSQVGDDNGAGTEDDPYLTIQRGIDSLSEGGILFVQPGTYNEKLRINLTGGSHNHITICSANNEDKAILDGTGVAEESALVNISGCQYLNFCNFEIINAGTGISVENSKAIILAGLNIHDISHPGGLSYGISVENRTENVMRSVLVYYNYFNNIGKGAAIHVSGNYENVNAFGNHIDAVSGNGLEYIGGNKICKVAGYDGPRNSSIVGNSIKLCRSIESDGYGVYLNTARNVTVEENIIYRSGIGIVVTSNIGLDGYHSDSTAIRNNLLASNVVGGIYVGTDPASDAFVDGVKIVTNTLVNTYSGDDGYNVKMCNVGNIILRKNILCNDKAAGTPVDIEESFVGTQVFKIDGNLYMSTDKESKAKFIYKGEEIKGFLDWKSHSGEMTGAYYDGAIDSLCEGRDSGDYTYNNKGTTVGAKILK